MKKLFVTMIAVMGALPMMAQETYENAKIATQDLNGTARYVGMGGALEALGADITTISTNPAGIGMFRKGTASVSFGVNSQQDVADFATGKTTKMSFDQAGFVASMRTSYDSWVNFGFNYRKSTNFNYILGTADRLMNASQNKLTYAKAKNGLLYKTSGKGEPYWNEAYASCSQLDDIYSQYLNYDDRDNTWYYDEATDYMMNRQQKGSIAEYDLNLSGNCNNKVYLGLTLGLYDVNYKHFGEYTEHLNGFSLLVSDDRHIKGTGVDLKAGIILRPIDESSFRIGAYVHTPTWYDLTTSNHTVISDGSMSRSAGESYDFKLYTPWKFGISAGQTFGPLLALGATFEFADYSSMDTRYNTGRVYDGWGAYEDSESDDVMNRHTEETLQGVATVKVGAELRPVPTMSVRLGYNYVSAAYATDGVRDMKLNSPGVMYASTADYVNWKGTSRITSGVGFRAGRMNVDLAYQYSLTNGDFHPMQPFDGYVPVATSVNNKRHQLLLTLGYTF